MDLRLSTFRDMGATCERLVGLVRAGWRRCHSPAWSRCGLRRGVLGWNARLYLWPNVGLIGAVLKSGLRSGRLSQSLYRVCPWDLSSLIQSFESVILSSQARLRYHFQHTYPMVSFVRQIVSAGRVYSFIPELSPYTSSAKISLMKVMVGKFGERLRLIVQVASNIAMQTDASVQNRLLNDISLAEYLQRLVMNP